MHGLMGILVGEDNRINMRQLVWRKLRGRRENEVVLVRETLTVSLLYEHQ